LASGSGKVFFLTTQNKGPARLGISSIELLIKKLFIPAYSKATLHHTNWDTW